MPDYKRSVAELADHAGCSIRSIQDCFNGCIIINTETVHGGRLGHACPGRGRSESDLPERNVRRGRCGSLGIYTAMHEERREGNEGRILSVQRGVGFQAHRVPPAGEIRAVFIFDAGNGRWRYASLILQRKLCKRY